MPLAAPISRIMKRDVVTVSPGSRVSEARMMLIARRVHHLPVVRGGELVGIVSSGDLRRYGPPGMFPPVESVDAQLDCYLVTEVMTHEPITVGPDDPIRHAVGLLRLDSFSALPVVEGTQLVGILTIADVLGYMLEVLDSGGTRWDLTTS